MLDLKDHFKWFFEKQGRFCLKMSLFLGFRLATQKRTALKDGSLDYSKNDYTVIIYLFWWLFRLPRFLPFYRTSPQPYHL